MCPVLRRLEADPISKKLPKLETFHRAFVELMVHYQQRFEIMLPPLNSTLILYRHIKRLAIPSMSTVHHLFAQGKKLTCV